MSSESEISKEKVRKKERHESLIQKFTFVDISVLSRVLYFTMEHFFFVCLFYNGFGGSRDSKGERSVIGQDL